MSGRAPPTSPRGGRGAAVPTLDDVARRAGVSTATVSRCLNSPERVVEKTRNRVLAAVRDLGYAPNFGARVLAAKRTNTIGAIIPTMENAIFARGIQAFQEELDRNGMTLLVASSSYSPSVEETQVRTLTARGADGLLLIGQDRAPEVYEFLDRRGLPHVLAWTCDAASPRVSVGFDNRGAMLSLAQAVIARGHRGIAVISAPTRGNDRARERVEGVLAAVRQNGLDPASVRIVETPYSVENGAMAFQELMQGQPRPTAVMCGNDVLAVGALGRAREMGLVVPQDVSVTGFDDIEIARIVNPRLTTLHVPHREMGRRAAQMLLQMLTGGGRPSSVELATDLRLRETLGAPGQSPATPR